MFGNRRGVIGGMLLILFVIFLIVVIAFVKEDPIDITANFGCVGGRQCLVGEILRLNVKLNSPEDSLLGQNKSITLNSDAIEPFPPKEIIIGTETPLDIPLKVRLSEGKYKIKITSDLINVGGLSDKIRLGIKNFIKDLLGLKFSYSNKIDVRYPIVKVEDVGYDCKDSGFYLEEIKLKLEDDIFKEDPNCKIRVYTDKLTATNHNLLTENSFDEHYHYYDTGFTPINKQDLSGSIQKVEFNAGPAIEQTNTRLIPVCLIDGNEVEIEPYSKELAKCYVNS